MKFLNKFANRSNISWPTLRIFIIWNFNKSLSCFKISEYMLNYTWNTKICFLVDSTEKIELSRKCGIIQYILHSIEIIQNKLEA